MMPYPIVDWRRLFSYFLFAPGLAFDAGFIAPPAILLRRARVHPSDQVLRRFANVRNQAIAKAEIHQEQEARNALLNSQSANLKFYRNALFPVKHMVAQALRKLNLI